MGEWASHRLRRRPGAGAVQRPRCFLGDTAPRSARGERGRTTASRSTLPSAQLQVCRSLGRPAPRGTMSRCSSLPCSTRYTLAASAPRHARWTRATNNTRIYAECETRGVDPVVPLRGTKSKQPALPLTTGGEFAHLKREHALAMLRVRGLWSASSFTPTSRSSRGSRGSTTARRWRSRRKLPA